MIRYVFTYKTDGYHFRFGVDDYERNKEEAQSQFQEQVERSILRRHPEAEGKIQFITA